MNTNKILKEYVLSPKNSYLVVTSSDKMRFLMVGGTGFIINYLVLTLLFGMLHIPILISQIVGAETALIATFIGNNFWAFRDHRHISVKRKLIRFHFSAGLGIFVNTSVVVILVHFFHLYYGAALVVGSTCGLVCNYTLYKYFVFKTHKKPE